MSTEATPLTAEDSIRADVLAWQQARDGSETKAILGFRLMDSALDALPGLLATLNRERAEHAALREKARAVVDDWDESLRLWLAAGEEEGDDGPAMTALRDPERAERHERNGAALRAALDGVKG